MTFSESFKSPALGQSPSSRLRLLFAYGAAAGLTLLTLFIRVDVLKYKISDPPALIFFLLPVVIGSYLGGIGPGLLATVLAGLGTAYYILPPVHSFKVLGTLHLAQWSAMIGEGVLISLLMEAIHRSRRRAQLIRIEQTVMLSSIGDGVITADRLGRVIFLNPEAERLTGWKDIEAIGQDLATVFHIVSESTGEAVENPVHVALREGSVTGLANHTLLLSRDGHATPISDSASPIRAPEGTLLGAVLVFRDATEERNRETALRAQVALRENLANIAATAPGVIYSFRLRPDGTMCFPYVDAKIFDIYGMTSEVLAEDAAPVFAMMHPDDADRVRKTMRESARALSEWHDEFRVQNPGRGEIWVEARSVPQREPDGGILWQGFIADVTERKRSEDRERENARRMQLVTDGMPALVAYVDSQYRYRFVNRQYEVWFGLPQTQICGSTMAEILGEEAFRAIQDKVDRVLAGERVAFETSRELSLPFADAELRNLQAVYVPDIAPDGDVCGFYGLLVDITGRKKAEKELLEKDRLLRAAMEAGRLTALEIDLATGILTETGPTRELFFRPSGSAPSTVDDWLNDIHEDDREFVRKAILGAVGKKERYCAEFRTLPNQDGDCNWVEVTGQAETDAAGRPFRFHGVAMDVTQRKKAEEALHSSRSQLTAALEAGGMGIWRTDLRTNRIWLDETSRKLWGLEHSGASDFNLAELRAMIHPDDAPRMAAIRESLFRQGTETATECRIVHPDGKVVWIASRGRLERDESGAPLRQTGIIMDITERKGLEEAQIRSQKLESLGTLAGGIAHDFNNILLAINGNATMAIDELPADHEVQQSLREIKKAGRRATELVRQILAFSRPGAAEKKITALEPVVREALKLVRATLPATIRVETHLSGNLPPVAVAGDHIYQVVVNLATNASHAIGSRSGLIEVRLESCEVSGDLAAITPGLHAGRYVVLSVRDDGCGMDAATLSRIFDPFFTTKPQGQGTGLGLSLVHGILKSHGGAIAVHSKPKEGTEFRLYFPPFSAPASASIASENQPGARPLSLRVMYVDDEHALVALASRVLKRMGHQVTTFTDPREALRVFTEAPQNFDIVVTDLAMPHISGLDLAAQLRGIRSDTPVVLTSGYVRPADRELAAACGIGEIILKPDTVEDLGHALDRVFRESAGADGKLARLQTSG